MSSSSSTFSQFGVDASNLYFAQLFHISPVIPYLPSYSISPQLFHISPVIPCLPFVPLYITYQHQLGLSHFRSPPHFHLYSAHYYFFISMSLYLSYLPRSRLSRVLTYVGCIGSYFYSLSRVSPPCPN